MADLKQGVEFSHSLLEEHICKGTKVVDATVGNGYDTEFLAQLVTKTGFVWGFDVQPEALQEAEKRLDEVDLIGQVKLIADGHQNLGQYIDKGIDGILFNLGYLPGSDKEIITTAETTLKAVQNGIELLKDGGIIILVMYLGHQGGQLEQKRLLEYARSLDAKEYNVLHYRFVNQDKDPPQVLAIKNRRNKNG